MVTMRPSMWGRPDGLPAGPPPQLKLADSPESVRTARTYVREFVTWHAPEAPEELVYDIQLVTSELVTNAYRYGTEPGDFLLVVLAATPGKVRIEVHDPCRRRPRARAANADRERGRGLLLVGTLATDWGVADRPLGKVVWTEHVWPTDG